MREVAVPPQFIVQDWPFVVLYQRTHSEWKFRMAGSEERTFTSGGTGHYEAIVKPSSNAAGDDMFSGVYSMAATQPTSTTTCCPWPPD